MTIFAEVVIPGPWWNKLTYLSDKELIEGLRVEVPVGRTKRVGFVYRVHQDQELLGIPLSRIKPLTKILDKTPPLTPDLWKLSEWIGRIYLCGQGEALSVICPTPFFKGETVDPISNTVKDPDSAYSFNTVFDISEHIRYDRYKEAIALNKGSSLIVFPEHEQAKKFFSSLSGSMKESSILWPRTGGKALWKLWSRVRNGFHGLVIGSQSASFTPLQQLSLIIIEEESSGAYIQQKIPYLNIKSILAKRAEICNARLILGGRLPSSRVYVNTDIICTVKPSRSRILFVDLNAAFSPKIPGVVHPFRISETALRETTDSLKRNNVALWILDRKGYIGEVACEECGRSIECGKCGGTYHWENGSNTLKCSLCGAEIPFPEKCPYCRGSLMVGKRPGIEALHQLASEILISEKPVVKWHADFPKGIMQARKIIGSLKSGGLIIGSRLALSLCDKLPVGSIVWIDADSEVRKPFYNSNFKAFSMIWESCWRGISYPDRSIVVQSRIPGKGWQTGISAGWDYFWRRELSERKELGLPPFGYLIQVDFPGPNVKEDVTSALLKAGLNVMDPGESEKNSFRIWISVEKLGVVFSALKPFFNISRSSSGFPITRIWSD